jgi:uncharacterized OsmC-like protein
MPAELQVHAVHEGGMQFSVTAGEQALSSDYPMKPGESVAGRTPLQMILASLDACSGSTVALLLERTKQPFAGLELKVRGAGVDPEAVQRALTAAETQLCPVWAMLKPGTSVTATFSVVPD